MPPSPADCSADLTPAPGRRTRTTSPYAMASFVRTSTCTQHHRVHRDLPQRLRRRPTPLWRERMAGVVPLIWGRREAECFSGDDWTGGIALMLLRKLVSARKPGHLIHRNPTPAIAGHHACAGERPRRPVSAGRTNVPAAEGHMTVAQQAFLFTGEIFVLSFVAIYAVWFADRLRRNFLG